ncbi:transposase [Allostreptomyces psammosilenae]|uniref:transposase n=1 Tax=Allostreptomyces psammosilenae TaxID=1892865 RepID=UPI00406BAB77
MPDDLGNALLPCPWSSWRHRYPGRLPADDRAARRGIIYALRKNASWRIMPADRIGCSGVTAWRHLRDWTEVCVWPRLTKCSWPNYAEPASSTWTMPRSTARTSER